MINRRDMFFKSSVGILAAPFLAGEAAAAPASKDVIAAQEDYVVSIGKAYIGIVKGAIKDGVTLKKKAVWKGIMTAVSPQRKALTAAVKANDPSIPANYKDNNVKAVLSECDAAVKKHLKL